jgi:hypothetical protein
MLAQLEWLAIDGGMILVPLAPSWVFVAAVQLVPLRVFVSSHDLGPAEFLLVPSFASVRREVLAHPRKVDIMVACHHGAPQPTVWRETVPYGRALRPHAYVCHCGHAQA